jgi:protein involved in polysaccharide export with SLBB domain
MTRRLVGTRLRVAALVGTLTVAALVAERGAAQTEGVEGWYTSPSWFRPPEPPLSGGAYFLYPPGATSDTEMPPLPAELKGHALLDFKLWKGALDGTHTEPAFLWPVLLPPHGGHLVAVGTFICCPEPEPEESPEPEIPLKDVIVQAAAGDPDQIENNGMPMPLPPPDLELPPDPPSLRPERLPVPALYRLSVTVRRNLAAALLFSVHPLFALTPTDDFLDAPGDHPHPVAGEDLMDSIPMEPCAGRISCDRNDPNPPPTEPNWSEWFLGCFVKHRTQPVQEPDLQTVQFTAKDEGEPAAEQLHAMPKEEPAGPGFTCPYLRQQAADRHVRLMADPQVADDVLANLEKLHQADRLFELAADLLHEGYVCEAVACYDVIRALVPGSRYETRVSDALADLMLRLTGLETPADSAVKDPKERTEELLKDSEDLRQIEEEWQRIWFTDEPSHLTPEPVNGPTDETGPPCPTAEALHDRFVGHTCAAAKAGGAPARQPAYVIEPPDILSITGLPQAEGPHLVRPDGTMSLGMYGCVLVAGLTLEQTRVAVEGQLGKFIEQPTVSVDVVAYNSKFCYVILEGRHGEQVVRLPFTGSDTVLDALSQVSGLPKGGSGHMWLFRQAPDRKGEGQVLPINWKAITEAGEAKTNYQLLPGDRIFVKSDTRADIPNRPGAILLGKGQPQPQPDAAAEESEAGLAEGAGIKDRLQQPVSLHIDGMPLRAVLEDLHDFLGLKIDLDRRALKHEGIDLDRPVTVRLEGISTRSALHLLLHPLHLTFVVKEDAVVVTPRTPPADAAAAEEQEDAPPPRKVKAGCPSGQSQKEREVERKLATPVTLNFTDAPLKTVIEDLRAFQGINICVDEAALKEEGISLDRPVTVKLEEVSLQSALRLLLRQAHLGYVIKDEVLMITTEANESHVRPAGKRPASCPHCPDATDAGPAEPSEVPPAQDGPEGGWGALWQMLLDSHGQAEFGLDLDDGSLRLEAVVRCGPTVYHAVWRRGGLALWTTPDASADPQGPPGP